jgi:hypothetical protein
VSETYVVRCVGGPHEGDHIYSSLLYTWPLPNIIYQDASGSYQKISQSQLEDTPQTAHLIREAQYQWIPLEEGEYEPTA